MISLLVSLLTLSIPIAAQTLINLIAFGKLLQPVITLSIMVLVIMIALGALNIWQSVIVEVIQQKLMVKISLNLTKQFTHLSLDNFTAYYGPELVNRYFEIVTINKALASLLLYGVNLSLQLFFGLILLLFYHPFFLVFDVFIILCVILIIFIPYKKGLLSAKQECLQKHQIGAWLEELLANRFLFRLNNYHQYATEQADKRLVYFLRARNTHFRQLIKHQIGFYLLSAIASSLLLGLGGYLVINNQLSLGQLVAAEIVLGALINAFKRFNVLLENYYDLIASEQKIDSVLNLPCELIKNELSELIIPVNKLSLQFQNHQAFCNIGKPLVIVVESHQKQLVSEFILGFTNHSTLTIFVNDTLCLEEHRRTLRKCALLIRNNQWFVGSIYDNLRLNQPVFSTDKLKAFLIDFGLMDKIIHLPNGLKTILYDWELVFTETELIYLTFIRALLAKPQIIIIDHVLDKLNKKERELILTHLSNLKESLYIIITQHPELIDLTNRLVLS